MSGSFDPQASYVPAGLRKAVKEALSQGWTAKKSGSGGWFLHSPKRSQKFYVPITAKDPDALASKLRSLINKAYLAERSAFEDRGPDDEDYKQIVDKTSRAGDKVIEYTGAAIQTGPSPTLTCPDCDGEWLEIEGFMAHQKACQERVRVRLAAEQAEEAPEEGVESVEPSEGQTEDVPEQAQSGTIAHQEETLTDTRVVDVQKAKRRGWTPTQNDPLHRALYLAIRSNSRRMNESDSKWARRLADFFVENNLLDEVIPDFEPIDEVSAARVLAQIRTLVGADEAEEAKAEVAVMQAKVEELTAANDRLRTTLRTFADLAREETREE